MQLTKVTRNLNKLLDMKSMKLMDHYAQFNPSPLSMKQVHYPTIFLQKLVFFFWNGKSLLFWNSVLIPAKKVKQLNIFQYFSLLNLASQHPSLNLSPFYQKRFQLDYQISWKKSIFYPEIYFRCLPYLYYRYLPIF